MSDLRAAAQQALECLEWHLKAGAYGHDIEGTAGMLRALLAEPETCKSCLQVEVAEPGRRNQSEEDLDMVEARQFEQADPPIWQTLAEFDAMLQRGMLDAAVEPEPEPFVVKHYGDDERPIIKGNGFDGLEVGLDRDEAEQFVAWINARITTPPALRAALQSA